MPQVFFRHGEPVMVDYLTPGVIVAGDVIIVNDTPKIAHHDFATGELAALGAEGGVYEATFDLAIAADKKVYWDGATKMVTATAGALKVLGVTVSATTGATQQGMFRHDPAA